MYNEDSVPIINNCIFITNVADDDGGGNNFEYCLLSDPIARIPGDIDASGTVDLVDFAIVADPMQTLIMICENWMEGTD
jgi:hypothetical protein